jgi:hypothetical protein
MPDTTSITTQTAAPRRMDTPGGQRRDLALAGNTAAARPLTGTPGSFSRKARRDEQ